MFHSSIPVSSRPDLRRCVRPTRGPAGSCTLLLGFDPRTALAVARSLRRRQVRVVVGTLAEWETPIVSRAVAAYVALPRLDEPPAAFFEQLLAALEIHRVDTLIPLTDRALTALAPHLEALREKVLLLAPTAEQISLVLDKAATAEKAAELQIPVPKAVLVEGEDSLDRVKETLRFPVFLKPQSKETSCRAQSTPVPDVFSCATAEDLKARLVAAEPTGRRKYLVQEAVPGDDVGLAVVMQAGYPVSIFQYRARRMWPADGGVCVSACSEALNADLVECAVRLLRALSWEGVAELDFRHDRTSGRFALLEINGRFWGSTAAAVSAGADLPWLVWQLGHGLDPDATGYRMGRKVRWLEGDLRRLMELARDTSARGGWGRLGRAGWAFFWDFRPSVAGMYWSWRDPGPGFRAARIMLHWWCVARVRDVGRKLGGPGLSRPAAAADPAFSR